MAFFSKDRVNTGRQPEIDLLKAFCIGWMILLHTQECLAETENLLFVIADYACTFSGAAAPVTVTLPPSRLAVAPDASFTKTLAAYAPGSAGVHVKVLAVP